MDIRNFFGGKSASAAAPSSTLSDLKKKSKEPDVKSPTRSSPRKAANAVTSPVGLSELRAASASKKETSSKKAKAAKSKNLEENDDDSVIALSDSPPPEKKASRSSPRKSSKKESEKDRKEPAAKKKSSKTSKTGDLAATRDDKKDQKQFQLLDDDDVVMDDHDDDFVPEKDKRCPSRKRGKDGNAVEVADDADEEEEIVRKKAKINSKRRKDENEDSGDEGKKRTANRKKKDPSAARIINSDDEEECDSESMKRKEKAAMKRAMKPDSHGMRNQDIASAVAAASSHKPKEPVKQKTPQPPVPQGKLMSAAAFFGTEPVKHQHDAPSAASMASTISSSPMAIDKEQTKPSTPPPAEAPSAAKTPQTKLSSSSSDAPLSPKTVDNQIGSASSKPTTPARSQSQSAGKVTTPGSAAVDRRKSNYFEFVNREPPKHLGEKDLPEGSPQCLEGLTFVLTGILESFERDDVKAHLEKLGARVVASISKKTSYVVVGRDAGPAKLDKIRELKLHSLDEDGLIELIKTKAAHHGAKTASATPSIKTELKTEPSNATSKTEEKKSTQISNDTKPVRQLPASFSPTKTQKSSTVMQEAEKPEVHKVAPSGTVATELWVDKYKPKSTKNIVGQQGDKSCVNKLLNWLKNWNKNLSVKPNTNPFAQNPDGAGLKAALLSGPPGVGKTTTAHLVCRELNISVIEMNASDTRSKKSLESWVSTLLQSKSIDNCTASEANSKRDPSLPEHVLIMDEVDGMAGNEDRGGIAELIGLIKKSKVPVICICNDRAAQKIRSLANHCFDLRFYKPKPEQIKGAMLSMACREGVKIPPEFIAEVIEATNSDLRQVINQLQMYSSQNKGSMATYHAKKDVRMGIFQLAEKIFTYEENKNLNVSQRMELFFQDYSLVPLFVQENYAAVWPNKASSGAKGGKAAQREAVRLLARSADSLSYGDVFERQIRSSNDWSLLSGQALMTCAIPSYLMSGSGRCNNFPGWFGKTSHAGRILRIVQQLALHTSLATSIAGKTIFAMDYVPALRRAVIDPLLKEGEAGVSKVIEVFEYYDLIREDLDALLEADQWPDKPDQWKQVDSKVKASLTRQYNKSGHMTHYAMTIVGGGKKKAATSAEDDLETMLGEGEDGSNGANDESSSDQEDNDPMIKANAKAKASAKTSVARGGAAGGTRGGRGGSRGGRGAKK